MTRHGAVTDFAEADVLRRLPRPRRHPDGAAPAVGGHDELLFIIQHQTSELWMKLAIHELDAAREAIAADRLDEAFKLLARVSRIFEQLNGAWDVLRTMTPSDYTTFRDALGQSSGFQSYQYRRIEFILGNRNRAMLKPHAHRPELVAELEAEMRPPRPLRRRARRRRPRRAAGAARGAGDDAPSRAWRDPGVTAMWAEVYRDPRAALGDLRARREARRPRGLFPPLALQPRHHRRAGDRPEARHRRHRRRQLPPAHARGRAVPRALGRADRALTVRKEETMLGPSAHADTFTRDNLPPVGPVAGAPARRLRLSRAA